MTILTQAAHKVRLSVCLLPRRNPCWLLRATGGCCCVDLVRHAGLVSSIAGTECLAYPSCGCEPVSPASPRRARTTFWSPSQAVRSPAWPLSACRAYSHAHCCALLHYSWKLHDERHGRGSRRHLQVRTLFAL